MIVSMHDRLVIKLPLTNPTGKIRVKRRLTSSNYGTPVATRRQHLTDKDYVEWQISYATKASSVMSKVPEIRLPNGRMGFELTKILCEAFRIGILSEQDFNNMMGFVESVGEEETLEENQQIVRFDTSEWVKGGFKKFVEHVPLLIKQNREHGYFVEVILKHKQIAVGLQSMVFLCIYLTAMKDFRGKRLIGRSALPKEFGIFEIGSENKGLIIDVVKGFGLASQSHRHDILEILRQVKIKCRR